MFPSGYFYIISRKHGYALDVYDGQTKADANIIVWPQKFQDSDNQLWSFDQGRIVNKKSGHVLDIRSSAFKKDKAIIQNKRKDNKSQEWGFDNGHIFSMVYSTMVLDIKGDSEDGGAQVLLYKRKDSDNLNQLWYLEPYHRFESSLNLAADAGPLHKKPGFGQPRLGYGAEVGVPPELRRLPDNINVTGVNGSGPTPSAPIAPTPGSSSNLPENLAPGNYPAGHQPPTQTQTGPQAQAAYHGQSGGYQQPPPLQQQQGGYQQPPPPQEQQGGYGGDAYPPPPPPTTGGSNFPPPGGAYPAYGSPPPQHTTNVYPPQQQPAYASPPQQHNAYAPTSQSVYSSPPQQHNTNVYPPSSPGYPPSSQQGYPPSSQQGYPPSSQQGYPPSSQPGYPASSQPGYPPSSQPGYPAQPPASGAYGGAYPPQPSEGGYPAPPPGGGFYPPQPQRQQTMQMPGMDGHQQSGYPPATGYPSYPQ